MRKRTLSVLLAAAMTVATAMPLTAAYAEENPDAALAELAAAAEATEEPEAVEETVPEAPSVISETPVAEEAPAAEPEAIEEAAQPTIEEEPAEEPTAEETTPPEELALATAEAAAEIAPEEVELDTVDASGSCGTSANWTVSGSTMTISGSGAITKISADCRGSVTSLEIKPGITAIGPYVFDGYTRLTNLSIPYSVDSIGFGAFQNCTGLQQVNLRGGFIGEAAFFGCSNLQNINVTSDVTGFGMNVFEGCNNIQNVNADDLGAWCRTYFCSYMSNPAEYSRNFTVAGQNITNLTIPNGITKVSDYAFARNKTITSVTIPGSVTAIGDYAFYMNDNLRSVNIQGNALKKVGAAAFAGDIHLTGISFPSSTSYLGTIAVKDCFALKDLSFGSGMSTIAAGAFDNTNNIKNVTFNGSQEQWNAITIGAKQGNLVSEATLNDGSKVPAANIHFNGSGAATPKKIPNGLEAGATVTFGSYEQDANAGKDTIEWKVLDVQGDNALIISKYILDYPQYYSWIYSEGPWENSLMRTWMNSTFINAAFTDAQKNSIVNSTISNPSNPVYGTAGGNATTDKVFALSTAEVEKYFANPEEAATTLTAYASKSGMHSNDLNNNGFWWTRTQGVFAYNAAYVHYSGEIRYDGAAGANTGVFGARPAMWVNKSALTLKEEGVNAFVSRLYRVCLGREPDTAGFNDWVSQLRAGKRSGSTAAFGFVFSNEFKNKNYCNECYVRQLYRAFMGREADASGLQYWINGLETGKTREEVFNGFALSNEFKALCNGYGIVLGDGIDVPEYGTVPHGPCVNDNTPDGVTSFVTRLYNVCLDRQPDAAGLKDWTTNLWSHNKSGRDVSYGFIFSKEFQRKKLNNADYVEYMYKAFFNRASDASGKADWVGRLNSGASREDIFNGFVGSQEFNRLCQKYGIVKD